MRHPWSEHVYSVQFKMSSRCPFFKSVPLEKVPLNKAPPLKNDFLIKYIVIYTVKYCSTTTLTPSFTWFLNKYWKLLSGAK